MFELYRSAELTENLPSTSGSKYTEPTNRTPIVGGAAFVVCAECHKRANMDNAIASTSTFELFESAIDPTKGTVATTSQKANGVTSKHVSSEFLKHQKMAEEHSFGATTYLPPLGLVEENAGSDDEFDANEQQPFWNSPAMNSAKGYGKLPSFVFSSTTHGGSTPVRLSTSVSDALNSTLPRSHPTELRRFGVRSPNDVRVESGGETSQLRPFGLKKSSSLSFVWETLAAIQEVRRLRAASTTSLSAVGRRPLRHKTDSGDGKRLRISCDSEVSSIAQSSSSRQPCTLSSSISDQSGLGMTSKRSPFDWKGTKKIGKLEKLSDDDEQLSRLYMEPPPRGSFADTKSDTGKGVVSSWRNLFRYSKKTWRANLNLSAKMFGYIFSSNGKKRVSSGSYASLPDMDDRNLSFLRKS